MNCSTLNVAECDSKIYFFFSSVNTVLNTGHSLSLVEIMF